MFISFDVNVCIERDEMTNVAVSGPTHYFSL